MKNKKLFITIYSILIIIVFISVVLLNILGKKERIGYLSEFKLNIDKTLQINGLDIEETKKLFDLNDKLDVSSITNYIFTNNSITNYSYDFRIKYYSKVFRNSDIYGVYPNIDNILSNNGFIKEINIGESGSPFGNFISTKIIDTEKIDSINYKLKLKVYIWIIFIIVSLIGIFLVYKKLINKFNINKKLILRIYTIVSVLIVCVFVLFFILTKLNYKSNLQDLQLVAETKIGYLYQAKIVSSGLFSDNFIYDYAKKLSFDKKPDYIKYGYNLELTTAPDYDNRIGSVFNNDNGTFTVSNSTSWIGYGYNLELSKGERYIVTLEAKKISGNLNYAIKYDLNYWDDFTYIPNTDKMTDDYKIYISELEIKKDKISKHPSIQLRFPLGVFNVKYLKIEQELDNLYLKSGNTIVFTSSKEINDINDLGSINYKLNISLYFIILVFMIIISLSILYFSTNIINILNKFTNNLKNYIDFDNKDDLIIFLDNYQKYKISNILFIIYIIILAFIIFSINFVNGPNNDVFWCATNYDIFYNIYDFKGYFWQRGRHFADMLIVLSMRPFGTILINIFNIDPFKSLMLSKALFSVFYTFLTTFSVSLFVWTINNKKKYKLIFLLVSLYICNYTNIAYYVTLACYVGGFGFSMLVFYPMIYYFVYGKEILLFKNKNMHYMLYFLFLYFSTFSMEPTSTTLAGFSFFIILYLFIRNTNLFFDNNNRKPNFYILFILLSTIVLTLISFSLTAFFSGRGKWQSQRISNTTIMDSIINKFSSLSIFNKILILLGILYLVYLLFILLKSKKIIKENYIYFSISFTALFLILFFYSIDAPTIYAQLILLFTLLIIILLKNTNNKNIIFSLLSNFILFFLIFTMSLNLLKYHDNIMENSKTTFRDWSIVLQIYKDAYNNNLDEIVINKDDIERLKLGTIFYKPPKKGYGYDDDPNTHYNIMLSEFMQRYYINKYIPIIVFYD
ncbi:hypothetical protein BPP43_08470 [Brachyspira pilosicoli P43/6/78]|uniref:Uncharacterized protein n=1 Tax=Brachyspira pilosicoli P43/6/78 TaxID=1042417 RepID=A0A3B6VY87_BRAPL|nr:hypothetical protein [Brachyspira pilosicoli]AGA66889.1 hypothetical protein BPP43_08470 [Brachyspira pilosicoli P43/6/78]